MLATNDPKYPMRPEEVARELAVSVDTVLRLIHDGELAYFMPGRFMYRVLRSDLEDFKRAHATSEGWPYEPDWSSDLITIKHLMRDNPSVPYSQFRSWVRVGVFRAVRIHRMIRLFPETISGMKYGFPAATAKDRARWTQQERQ